MGSMERVRSRSGLEPVRRSIPLICKASDYRNGKSLVRRQAAERHLEDSGIYRKRWWA